MIKKVCVIIVLFFVFTGLNVYASDILSDSIDKELDKIDIEGFDITEFKNDIISGGEIPDTQDIVEKVLNLIFNEAYTSIKGLLILIIPILLTGILSNLSLKEDGVAIIAHIACYLAICSVIIYIFIDISKVCRDTVESINIMTKCMIPVLYSLMLTLGNITTYTVMHPAVLFMSQFFMLIVNKYIFPMIMLSFALNVTDNIANQARFKRIAALITRIIKWALIFLITLFTTILSAQNILGHSFDSVAVKGTKFAIANFIPVVGGALADGVEKVGASLILIKNATGIAGIAGVIVIALVPIIKIYSVSLMLYILSAISQTIAGDKIADVLDNVGSTVSLLGSIVVSMSFIFVISVAVIMGG